MEETELEVVCQYEDSDVAACFPGFLAPKRAYAVNRGTWTIDVGGNDCDGIVAVRLGCLTLTMGTDDARELAARLLRSADDEDKKDEDDGDRATAPRPPVRLFGLWAVTKGRPDGFWWKHVNESVRYRDSTPMTFVSRHDAHQAANHEWDAADEDHVSLTVAAIGVAPADD